MSAVFFILLFFLIFFFHQANEYAIWVLWIPIEWLFWNVTRWIKSTIWIMHLKHAVSITFPNWKRKKIEKQRQYFRDLARTHIDLRYIIEWKKKQRKSQACDIVITIISFNENSLTPIDFVFTFWFVFFSLQNRTLFCAHAWVKEGAWITVLDTLDNGSQK